MVPGRAAARGVAGCCGVALLALLAVSCSGSKNVSVRGQVLYKGQPIEGAVVTFHPQGVDEMKALRPSGLTDKDGNFTLSTASSEGAPVGDYIVTINWNKPAEQPAGKKLMGTELPPPPPDAFQGKSYASRGQSKLTAKVTPDTSTLEPFRLD